MRLTWITENAVLAREDGSNTAVIPSGDFSAPWAVAAYEDVTYEEQLQRVAIAIAVQVPLPDGGRLSPNQVRFSMKCVRATEDYEFPWLEESDVEVGGGGEEDSGSAPVHITPGTFPTMLALSCITAAMRVASFLW